MIEHIAIVGAGNGGKAAAVDLALQNKHVRLFEFPEFKSNLEPILETKTLTATGAVSGQAHLERVTCELSEAIEGVDTIMICTQALAHDRVAHEIAPFVRPEHLSYSESGFHRWLAAFCSRISKAWIAATSDHRRNVNLNLRLPRKRCVGGNHRQG